MKTITIKARLISYDGSLEVQGGLFEYKGIRMCIHIALGKEDGYLKQKKSLGYSVSEITTGLKVCMNVKLKREAKEKAIKALEDIGIENAIDIIEQKWKELK